MANNFDKFAILDSFLDEVNSYLPEIQANLDHLQQQPGDVDTLEETYRRTHTIAGSAAMMEFNALARVAQGMEDILGDALDRRGPLNPPTIGLLRRSFLRLSRLIEHVKSGADDAPILAEDEADRAAWRGGHPVGSGAFAQPGQPGEAGGSVLTSGINTAGAGQPSEGIQVPDWLAAFAAPAPAGSQGSQQPDSDAAISPRPMMASDDWATSSSAMQAGYAPAAGAASGVQGKAVGTNAAPAGEEPSFDDMLNAFQATASSPYNTAQAPNSPVGPWAPGVEQTWNGPQQPAHPASMWERSRADVARPSWQQASLAGGDAAGTAASAAPATSAGGTGFPPAQMPSGFRATPIAMPSSVSTDELRMDVETIRRQIATLRDVAASIHEAAQAMEDERGELRGFLDGSRDALDRLEEWAGQQMGLDLRQSPDSVRRYLPLSVIWVTTTRLKQLAALLTQSGRSVAGTQEQVEETLDELRGAIGKVGHIYDAMSAVGGPPDAGFSATVAHFSWAPPVTPEIAAAPSVESTPARDDRDSAERDLSPGARAELAREVREQLRRELEDEVRDEIAAEVRRDEEERLRQELQIQVRRQLLAELTPGLGGAALSGIAQVLPQMSFVADRAPKPTQVTSEQSPEALEVFRDEAQEHLQAITTGMAQLERSPGDVVVLQGIRRAMHTLKGAAGMMGFVVIQRIAHASEDLLDGMVEHEATLTPDVLSLLLDTSEALDQLVSGIAGGSEEQQRILRTLMARYAQVTGSAELAAENQALSEDVDGEVHEAVETTGISLIEEPEEPAEQAAPHESSADLSVRLQLSKLDDLVNLFGELLINRSVLEERMERLNRLVGDTVVVSERLRDVGTQLETRFEAATLPSGRTNTSLGGGGASGGRPVVAGVRSNGSAFTNEFDELELDRYTEFHRLSRGLAEGVADVVTLGHEMEAIIRECQASFARENRLSSDFQDRLLKARLVPLQSLIPRLYRAARASALREGKEIEFYSEGTSTEVDRKVFEEVAGPLLHLVRNAVNHGIERPEVRERAGKSPAGNILVAAAYEGNQVVISVRDDGGGIDPEKIRQTAIARGWIDPSAQLSDKELINLIFRPGVTTAEALTEEAGRGVGLDVVRDTVSRLRGTLEVDSTVGQGTVFTMKFPISLQIARAVLVKVGQQTLAIPMVVVDQIGRLDYYQRISVPVPAIEQRGERYPLAHLASYLNLTPNPVEERSSVLLVNAGKQRVALLVDAIVAQQEIVSKPLGPHLREVPGVAGAAVLGNGQVVLILELHELLAQTPRDAVVLPEPGVRGQITQIPTAPMPVATPSQPTAAAPASASGAPLGAPAVRTPNREFVVAQRPAASPPQRSAVPAGGQMGYVLVVDDSPSVRRVVSNMLKAHGWEVQTARDGVEALEVIARQMPAAVLLDIEMPRMDGYELMATVRSQEQYRHLPLIVLTSRAATKHQQRALQLGADAYVVKPYQDEELLSTIAALVQARQ
jgi:chemotaxis protein histidine kinase CheA/CheY-like chemotaxis protein